MERNEWREGWKVVAAGGVGMGTGVGLYIMVAGLFFVPIEAEFGWSRREIASAQLLTVVTSLFLPFLGVVIDNIGVRKVAISGSFLLAASYLLMSQITADIWTYYFAAFFLMLAGLATGPLVYTKAVNASFVQHRGLALGLTLSGVTLTAMVAMPLLSRVIETVGWREAFWVLAVLPIGLGLPFVWQWLQEPSNGTRSVSGVPDTPIASEVNGMSLSQTVRDKRFWSLVCGLVLANIAVGGMLSQLQPILYESGFAPSTAALLGSLFAISIALGRVGAGFFLDKWWPPGVASVFLVFPIVGLTLLLSIPAPSLAVASVAVITIGLAQGAEIDFMSFFVPRYFGLAHYGAIFGVLAMLVLMAIALGGVYFGYIFDKYGSYYFSLLSGVYCYAGGAFFVLVSGVVKKNVSASTIPVK